MSHSDLESPDPTCDHQGIHSSLKMLLLRGENLLLFLPRCVSHQPGWGAGAGSGKQLGEKQLPAETGRKNNTFCEFWTLWVKVKPCRNFQRWQQCSWTQHGGAKCRLCDIMGAFRFWVLISTSTGIWNQHNSKLSSINSDEGRSFHLPRPHPPQKLFWKGCLGKLS